MVGVVTVDLLSRKSKRKSLKWVASGSSLKGLGRRHTARVGVLAAPSLSFRWPGLSKEARNRLVQRERNS